MKPKVLIVDTHPVQYRSPIYAAITEGDEVDLSVVYYNDASVRGYHDVEFGKEVKWDSSLLAGHRHDIMIPDAQSTCAGFFGFAQIRPKDVLERYQPDIIIIHSLNNLVGFKFAFFAKLKGIACWLRVETQDEAFVRKSKAKSLARRFIYRAAYRFFDGAFCFGELNKKHLLTHGFKDKDIVYSRFSTVDRARLLTPDVKEHRRSKVRSSLSISARDLVVGFFGKLIPKKDPSIVLEACRALARSTDRNVVCLVVGSGELESDLRDRFRDHDNVTYHFVGFVNQLQITDYYLATDILVLPSRREGEVWGLVCNEALQAGCAVVMSDAVGAALEFGHLERCGIFPTGDLDRLVNILAHLSTFERSFDWAAPYIADYSTEAAATAITAVAARYGKRQ
ncbi:glycosyltransferase family 4 protein [Aliirhizobium smilacinae]|uniref:Glycosyltransferase family 4 protein n=1 Tax=Aliirhizobium smilacinae TaxID=1395944 RepID=A0A5C4XPB7_9HYPH|nr:glycosyltransferase family 4 protein [Rhizobium smilacinae]TNM65325.1 glycosyltransferase family 4 protein [Rhizobium smilacinae]